MKEGGKEIKRDRVIFQTEKDVLIAHLQNSNDVKESINKILENRIIIRLRQKAEKHDQSFVWTFPEDV